MDNFRNNILDFLNHSEKNVLSIKGKWGVGKTFYWNNLIAENADVVSKSNYSYVSLFGLNDLKELQSNVFYNALPLSMGKNNSNFKTNAKKLTKAAKSIPQISKYAEAVSALERSMVNDYLICIDDLERKNMSLSLSIILGYISNLTENCNCKVVLIFNDDTLSKDDKIELDKYREKVVDIELEYSPTSMDNIDVVFNSHPLKELVINTFSSTDVNNIRILKHVKWNIDKFLPYLAKAEESVKIEVISTIIILTYIHNEPSIPIRASDIERIFEYSTDKPKVDKELEAKISALGYSYFAEYEVELVNFIEKGWMDSDAFELEIQKLNDRQKLHNVSEESKIAWGSYNSNFTTKAEDVIDALTGFIDKHLELLSLREINPIINTINHLDSSVDTQQWLDRYVEFHLHSADDNSIGKLRELTNNDELLELISSKSKDLHEHYSIFSTLKKIVTHRGWNPADIDYLNSHSEEEIFNWLESDDNEDVMMFVRGAISIFPNKEGDDSRSEFGRKLHLALIKISKRSELDKYRLMHFFNFSESELV